MSMTCEYGTKNTRAIICNIDQGVCGYCRYCRTKSMMVMLPNYKDCNRRAKMLKSKDYKVEESEVILKEEVELKIEEVMETKEEEPKQTKKAKKEVKTKTGKVLFVAKGKAMVEVFGHNIRVVNTENKKSGDTIEIKYTGTFGKEDFVLVVD